MSAFEITLELIHDGRYDRFVDVERAKTATFIRPLSKPWCGDARLFQLSEPVPFERGHTALVVVSAVHTAGDLPRTEIFAADEQGKALSWAEMPGSFVGGLDHAEALAGLGFQIASVAP